MVNVLTTMDYQETMRALKGLRMQTGSLVCLGCGYEHNCSTHGCAILRNAVSHMEAALANYDHLSALTKQQAEDIQALERACTLMGPCPEQKLSNADCIRAMSDEELATMLNRFAEGEDAPHYCRNLPECDADMEADNLIPLERCQACLLHWLQQPPKGEKNESTCGI